MFGINVKVKLDLFHAVKRVTTAASKKHPYFHNFIQDFHLVFRAKGDSGRQRMQPTPPPNVLLANIESFTEKWKHISQEESNPILTNSVLRELDQLKKHISIGCLSEVPAGFGTNRNENLHRSLNRWLSGHKIGVDLVALLSTFFHIWNIKHSSSCRTSLMASFYGKVCEYYCKCIETGQEVLQQPFQKLYHRWISVWSRNVTVWKVLC